MQYGIDRSRDIEVGGDVVHEQAEPVVVTQVGEVLRVAGQEVVDPNHVGAAIE